jgi:hypothetical protein
MGNIAGKFSDQNDLVVTGQVLSANNNQATLNTALAETDYLRGTNVALQPSGLVGTVGSPIPDVAVAVQGTIGAALGGIGQGGTPSEEPGGGGIPCFIGITSISIADGHKFIRDVKLDDMVLAFDPFTGVHEPKIVTDLYQHRVYEYMLLTFEDGHSTGVDVKGAHRYWIKNGEYDSVNILEQVWHWSNGWTPRKIVEKRVIEEKTTLYTFTVADLHNYIANNDAVSNIKPLQGQGETQ